MILPSHTLVEIKSGLRTGDLKITHREKNVVTVRSIGMSYYLLNMVLVVFKGLQCKRSNGSLKVIQAVYKVSFSVLASSHFTRGLVK